MVKKPTKKPQQLTAWSFSRKVAYDKCPFAAKLKFIDKIKEPPAPPLIRGTDIHKKAEHYSTGAINKRPPELDNFKKEFTKLRRLKRRLEVELELAVTSEWIPCDWFASDAWLRAKIDALYTTNKGSAVEAIDYKTGKIRPDPEQLALYAAVISCYYPTAKIIHTTFWYLDHDTVDNKMHLSFSRAEAIALRKKFEAAPKKMLADKTFKPNPGNACSWCYFKRSKGGQCKF